MSFDKENLRVKMSGKEYLDYKKYQDKKPKFKFTNHQIGILLIIFSILIGIIFIMGIHEMFKEPIPINKVDYTKAFIESGNMDWSSLFKAMILINPAVFYFVIILIGFAWAIHGFGFIIIRR